MGVVPFVVAVVVGVVEEPAVQLGSVMVLESKVTAPFLANTRPSTVAPVSSGSFLANQIRDLKSP